MKYTPFLALFTLFLVFSSCKKEPKPFTPTEPFFRLKTLDVDVLPQWRQVKVLFQATDFNQDGYAGLEADDLNVYENGHLVDLEGEVRIAPDSIPYQLKTILVLDISKSVEGFIPQIKAACKTLINQKLDNQEIAIYTFDSKVNRIASLTKNKELLLNSIDLIPEEGLIGSTNLYEAIIEAADEWEDLYLVNNLIDGSMVVFTDGRHNAVPSITLAMAKAATEDKKVFIAALNSADLDGPALVSLAKTDDNYFIANDVSGLEAMFLSIQEEILSISRSVYYLYYTSPISDPAFHENTIMIEVDGNNNRGDDARINATFNSEGFGL